MAAGYGRLGLYWHSSHQEENTAAAGVFDRGEPVLADGGGGSGGRFRDRCGSRPGLSNSRRYCCGARRLSISHLGYPGVRRIDLLSNSRLVRLLGHAIGYFLRHFDDHRHLLLYRHPVLAFCSVAGLYFTVMLAAGGKKETLNL